MIILKSLEDPYLAIAGEILNFENSVRYWTDGRRTVVGVDIPESEYECFPRITDVDIVSEITCGSGYIFVPYGEDPDEVAGKITAAVKVLEKQMDYPRKYQTVLPNVITNVKVRTELSGTSTLDTKFPYGKLRSILTNRIVSDSWFTWNISHIELEDFAITNRNAAHALSVHVTSIFYDKYDVCVARHREFIPTFRRSLLRGYENITNERLNIFTSDHPLMFELNAHWSKINGVSRFRDIDADVYEGEYGAIPLETAESEHVCAKCHCVLYDENYVLFEPDDLAFGVAMCPLCVHGSSFIRPVEKKYSQVFRVRFPKTLREVLDSAELTPERRELFEDVLRGVHHCTVRIAHRRVNYTLIGDKHVLVNPDRYLFTGLARLPEIEGRRVCA